MKLLSLTILLFLSVTVLAQSPVKGTETQKSVTEEVQSGEKKPSEEKPSVESPVRKQRIPEQLDIFLPVVTNKYEPTA